MIKLVHCKKSSDIKLACAKPDLDIISSCLGISLSLSNIKMSKNIQIELQMNQREFFLMELKMLDDVLGLICLSLEESYNNPVFVVVANNIMNILFKYIQ